jgi:hypothetical protein
VCSKIHSYWIQEILSFFLQYSGHGINSRGWWGWRQSRHSSLLSAVLFPSSLLLHMLAGPEFLCWSIRVNIGKYAGGVSITARDGCRGRMSIHGISFRGLSILQRMWEGVQYTRNGFFIVKYVPFILVSVNRLLLHCFPETILLYWIRRY